MATTTTFMTAEEYLHLPDDGQMSEHSSEEKCST